MSDTNGLASANARQTQTEEICCSVVELRQYAMKPGRRDDLIALFEEHFIEGQEQYGMQIIGQFRNRNNPDRFVWMRGFADMEARRQALAGFYGGTIWQAHRDAANDTMLDSDNVLLLKPARATSGFQLNPANRPTMDTPGAAGDIVIATVYYFDAPVDARFVEFFEGDIVPIVRDAGATILGYFVTEPSENSFPQLLVREGENVFVWLSSFASEDAYGAYQSALTNSQRWAETLPTRLRGWLSQPEEVLELTPSRRSLLRHRFALDIAPH
ncbi:MAG: NIPSNAP family protein [Ktedonobacterales bacterium]